MTDTISTTDEAEHGAHAPEADEMQSPFSRGREVRELVMTMEEDEVLFLEPAEIFDAAIVGLAKGHGTVRVIYDCERCIEQIARHGSGVYEEAAEHFSFNTQGAYVGESGPLFVRSVEPLARRSDEPEAFEFLPSGE